MEFSQEFLNKYKDNASMQDVINHISNTVDGITVSDSSCREIIFETLYGLKEVLEKEALNKQVNVYL